MRFAAASDIKGLNPLLGASVYETYLAAMTMAWLIKTDIHGDATVPELATEIPSQQNGGISRDGKTITWHLRRNVKWSDGAPFTADDVVYSTQQVNNPANNVISRDGWDQIVRVDEPDKYTVAYHLKAPYSSFAVTFFSTGGANPSILPKHLLAKYSNLNQVPYNALPIGIGPFKYQAWNRGDSVVMVANPLYFRGRPKLDTVIYKTVQDKNTVVEQMRTHDLDMWIDLSPHYLSQVASSGLDTLKIPSFTFDHVDFNLRNPVLADVAVRKALRFAMNRPEIIAKVHDNVYQLDESPIVPASRFHLNLPLVPFDPAQANRLLDADGWTRGPGGIRSKNGRRLSLTFVLASGQPDNDTIVELIRSTWRQIGVDFAVKRYLDAQYFAPAAEGGILYGGKFDVALFGWGEDTNEDLSNLYACYRFPPDGQNVMHWCDPAADAAMNAAKTSYDEAFRKTKLDFVQRAVYDQVPTVVIDSRQLLAKYNDDLRNWHPNSVAPFDDMLNVDI